MKSKIFAILASLFVAQSCFAKPVDFMFTLTEGAETVTGLIEGLDSDGGGQSASRITITGLFDTYVFVLGDPDFISNSFDVSNSTIDITTVDILADANGSNNPNSFGTIDFLGDVGEFFLFELPAGANAGDSVDGIPVFTAIAAVPVPAGGALLLTGLGGMAVFRQRRKNRV